MEVNDSSKSSARALIVCRFQVYNKTPYPLFRRTYQVLSAGKEENIYIYLTIYSEEYIVEKISNKI